VNDQSLIVDNGEKYDHFIAARGNNYAFIYTYTGGAMKVRMGKITGEKVKASWFNPRTGEYEFVDSYKNAGVKTFIPKGKKENGNDWVLVLESEK
jgi:hypothetical protein